MRRFFLRTINALSRRQKRSLMATVDFVAIPLSLYLAFALRLGEPIPPVTQIWWLFLLLPMASLPVFWRFDLYRMVVRHMGARVIYAVIKAVTVSALLLVTIALLGNERGLPRSTIILYWGIAIIGVGGMRFVARNALHAAFQAERRREPVIIYGAGSAGVQTALALKQGHEYVVVAFIDDDIKLHGTELQDIRVYPPEQIASLADRMEVSQVLLAMPSVSRRRRRVIIEQLEALPLHVRTIPMLSDLVSGVARIDEFREVDIEDLLGRDPVPADERLLHHCIEGKVVMVTGAGGSIGSELCRQIVNLEPASLLLLDLSEYALYVINNDLHRIAAVQDGQVTVRALLGSVLDEGLLQHVMCSYGVHTVYHAAAYKHVPLVEDNVTEGVRNNVLGTYRCAAAATGAGVESFILISTDKAVRPTNVMGASKRMAELVLQAMTEREFRTRFTIVRFGNVLNSSGSVVPLFREQIAQGGPVTVTDPEVTRYFMTIPEAAELVIQAGSMGQDGNVFVLNMGDQVKIVDLARRMVNLMGLSIRDEQNPEGDIPIEFTGLRPGEKLYEELLIGENTLVTRHSMIMRAREASLSWKVMHDVLAQLTVAFDRHESGPVRAILLNVVDGYKGLTGSVDQLRDEYEKKYTKPVEANSKERLS